MQFNKANATAIKAATLKLLQEGLADSGITVEVGSGTYDDHEFTFKLKLSTTNESGESQAALDFKRYAHQYGLRADQLGTTFNLFDNDTNSHECYRITGLKPRRKSYPIITECIRGMNTGQEYGFRPSVVKDAV